MSGVTALSPGDAAIGVAAEQLAIAALLRRGHKVAVPVVDDDGVDLIVDYRIRVQVKSGRRRDIETLPGYVYSAYGWSQLGRSAGKVELFMLHGVTPLGADRWWIVPAVVFGDAPPNSLYLYEGSTRGRSARVAQYEEAWGFFDGDESLSVAGDPGRALQLAIGG